MSKTTSITLLDNALGRKEEDRLVVGGGGGEPVPLDLDDSERGDRGAHPGGRLTEERHS